MHLCAHAPVHKQVELANRRAPLEERKRKRQDGTEGGKGPADVAANKGGAAAATKEGKETKATVPQEQHAKAKQKKVKGKEQGVEDAQQAGAAPKKLRKQQKLGQVEEEEEEEQQQEPQHKKRKQDKDKQHQQQQQLQKEEQCAVTAGIPAAQKHRMQRAVALGGLSPAVLEQAVSLARRAGKVGAARGAASLSTWRAVRLWSARVFKQALIFVASCAFSPAPLLLACALEGVLLVCAMEGGAASARNGVDAAGICRGGADVFPKLAALFQTY